MGEGASHALSVIWAGCRAQAQSMARSSFYLYSAVLFPLLQMALLIAFYRYGGRDDALPYAVVGSGVMGLWLSTTFITSYIVTTERWAGTLELVLAAPASLQLWIVGRALASTALSLVSLGVTLAGARWVFGVAVTVRGPLLFLPLLAAITLTFLLLGTIVSALFVLTRQAAPVANVLLYPVFIVSGVVFPLEVLPAWLRPLAYLSPLYWATAGMRAPLADDRSAAGWSILALALQGAAFAAGATWCFRFIERRVRRDATLSFD
jgi:ABC-2 type transport system permease protein